ncbi:MAG: IS1634 family transposase [Pseudomonadota bacterium]|nr:IS1634 family transposase [Pseudomonadota bacterium]
MFLRQNKRRKNGKTHRYFSVVENRRTGGGASTQRQVLYLGEINDSQQEAWRQTLAVFDEDRRQYCELSLFPDDRPLPPGAVDAIGVKLDQMQLRRPRSFGDCWLGCRLWDTLQLSSFWNIQLNGVRGDVPWAKVLQLLVVNRLIDPGSELRIHRQWFLRSAMDELLEVDFAAAGKDRLYRCLDRILPHKDSFCQFIAQQWKTLFDTSFDVLLYDLTSTYFEGLCEKIPKARHGYNRDGRGDCRQVVIALVVTPDGLPLAYEVLAGNTTDKTTLRDFLAKIEQMYGKARRTWIMDRGIPTEATLKEMREAGTQYLVGTPRSMLGKLEQSFADKPWQQVHESMQVKLAEHEGEFYVLAHSDQRQLKERAMHRRRFKAYGRGLHALRRRCRPGKGNRLSRDRLLGRLAVLKQQAGRMSGAVIVHVPDEGRHPTPENFHYELNASFSRESLERDGSYILRSNAIQSDATTMWSMYMQLVFIEAAFKSMKSDLAIRPIFHRLQPRVEAHLFVAFMGYCLMAALRKHLEPAAPGLSPKAVLEQLGAIQMVDVCLPTTDGRWLIMPRHTEPESEQLMLLEKLGLKLPNQPPPRIRSGKLLMHEAEEPSMTA